jgi:TP901 family phage tail tape measure protein
VSRKRIKGITIELDGETKGLDKALRDVNKRSRDLQSELREVNKSLRFNPKDTELLAQKKKILGDQIEATKTKLDQLKAAEAQVQEQFRKGKISEEQYREFRREIIETESKLKHYRSELDKTQQKLQRFSQSVKEAGDKVKEAGKKMVSSGKDLTTKVTAPIAAVGGIAVKVGADFEEAMSKVAAVSGATGDELNQLTEMARELGASTVFSATEAAEGMTFLAMAGYDANQIMSSMPGLLDLAAAGQLDLARAADITTNIMSGFNMEADQTQSVADMLAAAAASANTSVEQMGNAMSYVAPVAAGAGLSIEETAAAIGILSNAGIQGERAGTALRGIIASLQNPTGQTAKALEELGLSADDVNPSMHSLTDILKTLEDAGMDSSQAMQLVGVEAGPALIAMLSEGSKGLDEYTKHLQASEGAASEMAATMTDNVKGDFKEFASALEELGIQIYETLQPALREIIQAVTEMVQWLQNLSPQAKMFIVIIAGLVAAIGPLLIILGLMAAGLGSIITVTGQLIGVFSKLLTGVKVIGAAIAGLSGPVLIAIGVITALIAIGVALWQNWDTIKEKAGVIFKNVKNAIVNAFQVAKDFIVNTWNNIKQFFSNTWNGIKNNATNIFNNIKNAISNAFNAVKKSISKVWNSIKSFLSDLWNGIKDTASSVFNGVKDGIVDAFNGVKDKVTGIWDSIWGTIKRFINKIIDGMNSMIGGLNKISFSVPDWVPGVGGKKFGINIPRIPRLATGGVVSTPTLAMVGDAGLGNPEIVAPEKMLRQIIKDVIQEVGTKGIVQNITINSPHPTSPADNARKIKQAARQLAMEW